MSAADPATTGQTTAPDEIKGGMGQKKTLHIRTGGPLGGIAKEVFGEDTAENRHHLWDWNRSILPSPEALVPSGTDLNIVEPGFVSGGPSLNELKRSDLTVSQLGGASTVSNGGKNVEENKTSIGQRLARTGDASVPEGEDLKMFGSEASGGRLSEARREREGRMAGDGGAGSDPASRHVSEGANGATAQRSQDEREAAAEGDHGSSEGASGSASDLPKGDETPAGGAGGDSLNSGQGADADFSE